MIGFLLRAAICAAGLWIAAHLVHGIEVRSLGSLAAAAVLLGVANAIVRPVLVVLTLPITVVTLGLFLLVINGAMLKLVALFLHGFIVHGWVPAILGALVVSITGWIASWFIGSSGVERRW
jgi:putative membrane protein